MEELSGNVYEWTRSCYEPYPYRSTDGRESVEPDASGSRVVRGGAFHYFPRYVRAACRNRLCPVDRFGGIGFRVGVSPFFSDL